MRAGALSRFGGLPGVLLWCVAIAYAGYVAFAVVEGHRAAARGDTPLFTDFTTTYAASILLQRQAPEDLYRPRAIFEAQLDAARAAYGHRLSEAQAKRVGYSPWMYPPTMLLFVVPLAWLPYLFAYLAWIVATLVPYLVALRRILGAPWAVPAALAAPPTFYNLMYGQTGFLTAGLIGLGLACLRARPWVAGVAIGLASVKPQFGLLIPFALALAGHWRVFASATLTVLGLLATSVVLFGDDPWFGFLGTMAFNVEGYGAGAYAWHAMTSVLSAAKLAGASMAAGWRIQIALGIAVAGLALWPWWRFRRHADIDGVLCALLCSGALVAVPFAYVYDVLLLVPAAAWLWVDIGRRGGGHWQRALVIGGVCAVVPLRVLPPALGVNLVLLGALAIFLLAFQRLPWSDDVPPAADDRRPDRPAPAP